MELAPLKPSLLECRLLDGSSISENSRTLIVPTRTEHSRMSHADRLFASTVTRAERIRFKPARNSELRFDYISSKTSWMVTRVEKIITKTRVQERSLNGPFHFHEPMRSGMQRLRA